MNAIMTFSTPLSNGQYAYICKVMADFPEITVFQGYAEYRGESKVGWLGTDEPEISYGRRLRIVGAARRAIKAVR